MAQFIVRNINNSNEVIKIGISLVNYYIDGKYKWFISLGTNNKDFDNNKINPVYIDNITQINLSDEITKAVKTITSKVKWDLYDPDIYSPEVIDYYPNSYVASINDFIKVKIKDRLPSSGIKKESIRMKINGVDVTPFLNIKGDANTYELCWYPSINTNKTV